MQSGRYHHPPGPVIAHEEPILSTASKNPMVSLQVVFSYTNTPEIVYTKPTNYLRYSIVKPILRNKSKITDLIVFVLVLFLVDSPVKQAAIVDHANV
jgi:hypothetical protein